jgi:hypothetical protein
MLQLGTLDPADLSIHAMHLLLLRMIMVLTQLF